jgi:hypothetical protein
MVQGLPNATLRRHSVELELQASRCELQMNPLEKQSSPSAGGAIHAYPLLPDRQIVPIKHAGEAAL